MSQITETGRLRRISRLPAILAERGGLLGDYATAVSGSAGRLVFSLLYFVALANTLSISDFGLFATASAAGVMLSRILGFGFVSAVYRVATVRPRLVGLFSGGFLVLSALSLPVLSAAAWLTFAIFFAGEMTPLAFATVVIAETLLWRPTELAIIVNNGMGQFGRAAALTIIGTLLRALAAVAFIAWPERTVDAWVWFYIAANAASLTVALAFFYPRQRLKFRVAVYWRRLPDSLYVAGAEILFYFQMELDKLLVLALGGPKLAGIYAIVMRLVDLTAIPIRAFTMMLVQHIMRTPKSLERLMVRVGIEGGVFAVSTLALLALSVILWVYPTALGSNVAEAAPLVGLALCIPGLRNLVEYQAELLFARGQTLVRAINLALLAGMKAVLLTVLLAYITETPDLILWLNAVFALLYLVSACLTYSALRLPARRI
jgi:O-antigen/teichoic acid export membrane protein